jgi:hypothetical protein
VADATVGDAWLPDYIPDGGGTNVVIVRNPVVRDLIEKAQSEGRLHMDGLSPNYVGSSQKGNLVQRREGLAYRLHLAQEQGLWTPPKRIPAKATHLTPEEQELYRLRLRMTAISHESFEEAVAAGDLDMFKRCMDPLIEVYGTLCSAS